MKQTMFNSCLNVGVTRFAKPYVMMACLVMTFMLGTQISTGQTMVELGETKSAHTIALIQDEMQFLEQEQKTPVGAVQTEKNHLIVRYYQSVLDKVGKGGDFKRSLSEIEATFDYSGIAGSNEELATSQQYDNSVMDPNSEDYRDLKMLVFGLNLSDDDDSDLEAIFTFWRTLKNR